MSARRPRQPSPSQDHQFVVRFEPRTPHQAQAARLYEKSDVMFFLGAAGSGKSHLAIALALRDLRAGKVKEVVYIRPAVACGGEELGFIPGSMEEKLAPWVAPFRQLLAKIAYRVPESMVRCEALGMIRGTTYENAVVILDESQDASRSQLKAFLTRLGEGAKLVVCGDPDQSDIRPTVPDYDCDLDYVADQVCDLPGVAVVDFEASDCVRHTLVAKILGRL